MEEEFMSNNEGPCPECIWKMLQLTLLIFTRKKLHNHHKHHHQQQQQHYSPGWALASLTQ
jgi:hypothetical protein